MTDISDFAGARRAADRIDQCRHIVAMADRILGQHEKLADDEVFAAERVIDEYTIELRDLEDALERWNCQFAQAEADR